MTVHAAQTICTWLIVAIVAGAGVAAVVVKRLAVRVLVVALAGMLTLVVVAGKLRIDDLATAQRAALCTATAEFLGIGLVADEGDCPASTG